MSVYVETLEHIQAARTAVAEFHQLHQQMHDKLHEVHMHLCAVHLMDDSKPLKKLVDRGAIMIGLSNTLEAGSHMIAVKNEMDACYRRMP